MPSSTFPLPRMPRKLLQNSRVRRFWSVRSPSSSLESLRPPQRRQRPLLVVERALVVVKVVGEAPVVVVGADVDVEVVGAVVVVL